MKKVIIFFTCTALLTCGLNAGMFVKKTPDEVEGKYKKKWKCPYCHMVWDEGQPCQNPDCPSKYSNTNELEEKIRLILEERGIFIN